MGMRQEKVQEQLVHELSDMIQKELRDPRLGFVTITGAEITRDLRQAKVFVSIMGNPEEQKLSLKALNGAVPGMRGEFTRRTSLRFAPEIQFHLDEGILRGQRIFELLHSVEEDLKPVPPSEAAAAVQEEGTGNQS